MKDMTSMATTMMTEEEKADMEKEMNGGATTPPAASASSPTTPPRPAHTPRAPSKADLSGETLHPDPSTAPAAAKPPPEAAPRSSTSMVTSPAGTPSGDSSPSADGVATPTSPSVNSDAEKRRAAKKKSKLTPEQRKQMEELEAERKKAMAQRVKMLTDKLIERLRPLVEAKHPGDKDDEETRLFEQRIKTEADDLKLESFGVEASHISFGRSPPLVSCILI